MRRPSDPYIAQKSDSVRGSDVCLALQWDCRPIWIILRDARLCYYGSGISRRADLCVCSRPVSGKWTPPW